MNVSKTPLSWRRVGHNPATWVLEREIDQGGEVIDIRATVFRLSSGRWGIRFALDGIGFIESEPSRRAAMDVAEEYLNRDYVKAHHAWAKSQREYIASVCALAAQELETCLA